MIIRLYSFNKKVNSTARPSGSYKELNCNIKDRSSVINPVIELKTKPLSYNYAYLPEWDRYYFINDISYDLGVWILQLNVDVLASFKSTIGNTDLYITRSSTRYDGGIQDTYYPATTRTSMQMVESDTTGYNWTGFDDGVYILGLQGMLDNNVNGVLYYQLDPGDFADIISGFYSNTGSTWWGNLQKGVINSLNKIDDFIVSCTWFPVRFVTETTAHRVFIGSYNTGINAHRIKEYPMNFIYRYFDIPRHPQASTRGSYLNDAPYSRYEFHDTLIGRVDLNPQVMKNISRLIEEIDIDFTTAEAHVRLFYRDGATRVPIYSTFVPFGCKISLTGSDVNVQGLMSDITGAAVQIATGDALGMASNIGNAALNGIPSNHSRTASGGYIQFNDAGGRLVCYFREIVDANNADKGRPWCQIAKPSSIGGYMEAENPHVTISGTANEADMINSMIASGIYYE